MKTRLQADEGKQDLLISRTFDLPLALLFKAYTEAELVAQWMGTTVVKLESKTHGSYCFETNDAQRKLAFRASGVIHELLPDQRIVRTFEMENSPFPVQLEFLEFEALNEEQSQLRMQIVYKSAEAREQMPKLPFAQGLNNAHDRLEKILQKSKPSTNESYR